MKKCQVFMSASLAFEAAGDAGVAGGGADCSTVASAFTQF